MVFFSRPEERGGGWGEKETIISPDCEFTYRPNRGIFAYIEASRSSEVMEVIFGYLSINFQNYIVVFKFLKQTSTQYIITLYTNKKVTGVATQRAVAGWRNGKVYIYRVSRQGVGSIPAKKSGDRGSSRNTVQIPNRKIDAPMTHEQK